jgi:hypothetical protein
MNTSGTGTVFAIGYWVVLAMTIMCAVQPAGDLGPRLRAPRPAALALVAVVAVPSLIELGWHGIYTALYRAPDQIKDQHEYWRLLTGSIVQDGGLEGTIFNLLVLFVIATLAVYAWGGTRAIGLFLVGVLGFNLIATYAFAAPGGGNSAATIFLATSMVGLAVVRRRVVPVLAAAVVVVAAGVTLIAVNDAHGIPILGGLAIGRGAGSGRLGPGRSSRGCGVATGARPSHGTSGVAAGERRWSPAGRWDDGRGRAAAASGSRWCGWSGYAIGRAVGGMATGSTLSPLR